jgi:excisionase family DNA binding protein
MVEPQTMVTPPCNRERPGVTIPRLALTVEEAAEAVGVGRSFFYQHVLPDLRIVRVGRRRLVPVRELERWLDESATRAA